MPVVVVPGRLAGLLLEAHKGNVALRVRCRLAAHEQRGRDFAGVAKQCPELHEELGIPLLIDQQAQVYRLFGH